MTRRLNTRRGRAVVSAVLVLTLAFGGCRPSFSVSPAELERARTLPPDAPVRGFEGRTPVVLRAGAVNRSVAVSKGGERRVEDPGLDLRRAAWGTGGTAIGFLTFVLPLVAISSEGSDSKPLLIPTLITAALTGMAIGFGITGNLDEDEFLYADEPLVVDTVFPRGPDHEGQRRFKADPAPPHSAAE